MQVFSDFNSNRISDDRSIIFGRLMGGPFVDSSRPNNFIKDNKATAIWFQEHIMK